MEKLTTVEKEIIKDLKASDSKIVLQALKKSRKEGSAMVFQAILDVLKDTDEPLVESAIIEFLYDLKDETSIPILIQAIENEAFEYYSSFLIAAFWQSAIDGSDHIQLFVKKAIESDYMTALEALTVVENFDSTFDEQLLDECKTDLSIAIDEEEDEDKKSLLESLHDVIQNLAIEGE